jgi:homopolymeric O-antigen transport system ATP-binding protein
MSAPLISVEGLSKKFCLSLKRSLWYGLKDISSELRGQRHGGGGGLREEEFWAIRDVNFQLNRGECLGLIGHNGAGKTTLLRMLNGLIKPDAGRIQINGQVGALIALGAGFNPILTGRENIYVNASVLGLSKKYVDSKLDEIVDFAEIDEFIDTPVQNYSSGMNVRLGFSIAAVLIKPDVLFLDEVLAVGDIGFVIKCLNTVRSLSAESAVVFVSHSMQHISSFCTRVMVMKHGSVLLDSSNVAEGIDKYYSLVHYEEEISGTGGAQVLGLELVVAESGLEVRGGTLEASETSIYQGASVSARLRLHIDRSIAGARVSLTIHDETMAPIICMPVFGSGGQPAVLPPGEHLLELSFGKLDLNSGKYSFVVSILEAETAVSLARVQGLHPFRVFAERKLWGKIVRPVIPFNLENG